MRATWLRPCRALTTSLPTGAKDNADTIVSALCAYPEAVKTTLKKLDELNPDLVDKKYLQKRKNTWYVVVAVPKALRVEGGPARFIQSLRTSSLAEANRTKYPHVVEFHRRIVELKKSNDPRVVVLRDASEWKAAR